MKRVRFAPSPTGSLHIGNALAAVANRRFGDWLLLRIDDDGALRWEATTLVRPDGTATYQLASVVDDIDFGITHVIRGSDHRPNEPIHRRLTELLGATPPEYVHFGLVLGPQGGKLSKRDEVSAIADLREAGIRGEAVRAYLDELGLPKHDVQLDLARIRRLAIEAIATMSDDELAGRVGAPHELV